MRLYSPLSEARASCSPMVVIHRFSSGTESLFTPSPLVPEAVMSSALPGEKAKASVAGHLEGLKLLVLVSVCT